MIPAGSAITAEDAAFGALADAVQLNTNPVLTAASFSTETEIPRMQLSAEVRAGENYVFTGQLIYAVSNTDTESDIRIRLGSTSGFEVGKIRLGKNPTSGNGQQVSWSQPWKSPITGTQVFVFTILRGTGTGNTTLEGGGNLAWNMLLRVGAGFTIRSA